jgi:hypothetical protein
MSVSSEDILETFPKGEVVEKDGQILSKELAKIYEINKKSAEYSKKK